MQIAQAHHAERTKHLGGRETAGSPGLNLVPARKEAAHRIADIVVNGAVGIDRVS
jgi:hypothetical protein